MFETTLADQLYKRLDRAISDVCAAPTQGAMMRAHALASAWERHAAVRHSLRHPEKSALSLSDREYLADELLDQLGDRSARRRAEHELAEYIAQAGTALHREDFGNKAESMSMCRISGCCGITQTSKELRVAWDHKCGDDRLCPDEARERTKELASRVVPEIQRLVGQHPDARVFFAVFTCPNFEPGRLRHGMDYIYKRWSKFLDASRPCTDEDRRRWGYDQSKRQVSVWQPGRRQPSPQHVADPRPQEARRKWLDPDKTKRNPAYRKDKRAKVQRAKFLPYAGTGLLGSVTTLEAPLSTATDNPWNVHLNALLVVRGRFDFEQVRAQWGANVEIRQVKASDRHGLIRAVMELLKYAAQLTPEKSSQKAKTTAPAMTQWPFERFAEWYDAHTRFRRVRSYGRLYGLEKPEKETAEPIDWLGVIEFTDAGAYSVDLIPDDKSPRSRLENPAPGYRVPQVRPPTRH